MTSRMSASRAALPARPAPAEARASPPASPRLRPVTQRPRTRASLPRLPRPLAAPTFALALIVAGAPLSLLPANPVSAAVVAPYTSAGREPLAPRVDHHCGRLSTSAGSQTVDLVEVDQSNPAIFFEASLSNGRV